MDVHSDDPFQKIRYFCVELTTWRETDDNEREPRLDPDDERDDVQGHCQVSDIIGTIVG